VLPGAVLETSVGMPGESNMRELKRLAANPQVPAVSHGEASACYSLWLQQEAIRVENQNLQEIIEASFHQVINSCNETREMADTSKEMVKAFVAHPQSTSKNIEPCLQQTRGHNTLQKVLQRMEEPTPCRGVNVYDFWSSYKAFHDMDGSSSTQSEHYKTPSSSSEPLRSDKVSERRGSVEPDAHQLDPIEEVPLTWATSVLGLNTEILDRQIESADTNHCHRSRNINGSERKKRQRDRKRLEAARISALLVKVGEIAASREMMQCDPTESSSPL